MVSCFDSDAEATDAPSYLCICLLGQVIKVVFFTSHPAALRCNLMFWFRNGTTQFSVPLTLSKLTLTLPVPLLSPLVVRWRGELEAWKVNIMGCEKNNLLETAMIKNKQQQCS